MESYKNIDQDIKSFPSGAQDKLQQIRNLVHKLAPTAEETISYSMPTFKVNGKNLVHFAAFKNHIGLYPTPSAITEFDKELSSYKTSKGAIQFPSDKDLPIKLIEKIIKFRISTFNKV